MNLAGKFLTRILSVLPFTGNTCNSQSWVDILDFFLIILFHFISFFIWLSAVFSSTTDNDQNIITHATGRWPLAKNWADAASGDIWFAKTRTMGAGQNQREPLIGHIASLFPSVSWRRSCLNDAIKEAAWCRRLWLITVTTATAAVVGKYSVFPFSLLMCGSARSSQASVLKTLLRVHLLLYKNTQVHTVIYIVDIFYLPSISRAV